MAQLLKRSATGLGDSRWFRKHWRSSHYPLGDMYQDDVQEQEREEWALHPDEAGPYLRYVKEMSYDYPELRLLADFMEVGTDPLRWRNYNGNDKNHEYTYPDDKAGQAAAREKRVSKTRVAQLVYRKDGTVADVGRYEKPEELKGALAALDANHDERAADGKEKAEDIRMRLFVVEDLSREVIEQFGAKFDIDPHVFRAHIFDNIWYNIRDLTWDPPSLKIDIARSDWFQLRFVRARYFSSHAQFVKAQAEPNKFNVERKLYEDENKAFWDRDPKPKRPGNDSGMAANASKKQAGSNLRSDEESQVEKWLMQVASCGSQEPDVPEPIDGKVGTIRTRATFWRSKGENGKPDIGVLLLDPTIKGGFQLWRGHKNWARVPKMRAEVPNAADTSNGSRGQGAEPPNAPDTGNGLLGTEAEARNVPGERNGSRDGEDKAHKAPVARKGRREELSFFEDYIRWAKEPGVVLLKQSGTMCTTDWPHDMTPMLALLRLVCAEWLVISQYIKTRLSQVSWEIEHPNEFLYQTHEIDTCLNKLHTWRRLVPVFREMLLDATACPVFAAQFFGGSNNGQPSHGSRDASVGPLSRESTMLTLNNSSSNNGQASGSASAMRSRASVPSAPHRTPTAARVAELTVDTSTLSPLDAYQQELSILLLQMEEYEKRIDRLTAVVTSAISIVDSRRVERLTLLATLFVPMSLVGTLFSMTDNVPGIGETFGWWAIASACLLVVSLIWAQLTRNRAGRRAS